MAGWDETTSKALDNFKERPVLMSLLVVMAVGAFLFYEHEEHKAASVPAKQTTTVNSTGDHNQNTGTNNGTMNQVNH